jgi:hypothetical protein
VLFYCRLRRLEYGRYMHFKTGYQVIHNDTGHIGTVEQISSFHFSVRWTSREIYLGRVWHQNTHTLTRLHDVSHTTFNTGDRVVWTRDEYGSEKGIITHMHIKQHQMDILWSDDHSSSSIRHPFNESRIVKVCTGS